MLLWGISNLKSFFRKCQIKVNLIPIVSESMDICCNQWHSRIFKYCSCFALLMRTLIDFELINVLFKDNICNFLIFSCNVVILLYFISFSSNNWHFVISNSFRSQHLFDNQLWTIKLTVTIPINDKSQNEYTQKLKEKSS